MAEGLIVKGALMAVGSGIGGVIVVFIGWGIVQFVLAKYGNGKKKDNKDNAGFVTQDTCVRHHEEMKDLIRAGFEKIGEKTADEFAQVREGIKEDHEKIYDRIWEHATDSTVHSGGRQ